MQNKRCKLGTFSLFLMIAVNIFLTENIFAEDIDAGKSKIDVVSRSVEEKSPVMGETLAVRVTLKDSEGKPVAGINGDSICLFIEEGGTMTEKVLNGKSGADGIIYDVFRPKNIFSEETIKFAVKVNDIFIQKVYDVKYNKADEFVDQAQPLWNGSNKIFGNKNAGQTFSCGNISEISRIKIMLTKNAYSSIITMPVLKLYEWKTDYKTTVAAQPLAVSQSPEFDEGRYFGKDLAIYSIKCQMQAGKKYYLELSIPDNSGDEKNFINVYRTWNTPGGATPLSPDSYPDGTAYFNGQENPKSDLMFFTFYKNNQGRK